MCLVSVDHPSKPLEGIGEVRVCIGKGRHFILKNVLYCPKASVTLISVDKLCDDSHEASF
jgi:hypothetical protein